MNGLPVTTFNDKRCVLKLIFCKYWEYEDNFCLLLVITSFVHWLQIILYCMPPTWSVTDLIMFCFYTISRDESLLRKIERESVWASDIWMTRGTMKNKWTIGRSRRFMKGAMTLKHRWSDPFNLFSVDPSSPMKRPGGLVTSPSQRTHTDLHILSQRPSTVTGR